MITEPERYISGRKEKEMTREERIEWLKNATNEEVVNQLRWAVAGIYSDMIELQVR